METDAGAKPANESMPETRNAPSRDGGCPLEVVQEIQSALKEPRLLREVEDLQFGSVEFLIRGGKVYGTYVSKRLQREGDNHEDGDFLPGRGSLKFTAGTVPSSRRWGRGSTGTSPRPEEKPK